MKDHVDIYVQNSTTLRKNFFSLNKKSEIFIISVMIYY